MIVSGLFGFVSFACGLPCLNLFVCFKPRYLMHVVWIKISNGSTEFYILSLLSPTHGGPRPQIMGGAPGRTKNIRILCAGFGLSSLCEKQSQALDMDTFRFCRE